MYIIELFDLNLDLHPFIIPMFFLFISIIQRNFLSPKYRDLKKVQHFFLFAFLSMSSIYFECDLPNFEIMYVDLKSEYYYFTFLIPMYVLVLSTLYFLRLVHYESEVNSMAHLFMSQKEFFIFWLDKFQLCHS